MNLKGNVMDDEKFFPCDCGEEAVRVARISQDEHQPLPEIELAIFHLSCNGDGFWHRFRQAWHCLRRGSPYGDQVVLDRDTARAMGEHLLTLTERAKNGKDDE